MNKNKIQRDLPYILPFLNFTGTRYEEFSFFHFEGDFLTRSGSLGSESSSVRLQNISLWIYLSLFYVCNALSTHTHSPGCH